jgi:hypothetical protein
MAASIIFPHNAFTQCAVFMCTNRQWQVKLLCESKLSSTEFKHPNQKKFVTHPVCGT